MKIACSYILPGCQTFIRISKIACCLTKKSSSANFASLVIYLALTNVMHTQNKTSTAFIIVHLKFTDALTRKHQIRSTFIRILKIDFVNFTRVSRSKTHLFARGRALSQSMTVSHYHILISAFYVVYSRKKLMSPGTQRLCNDLICCNLLTHPISVLKNK